MSKLYDGDVVAWAYEQAALLRSGRLEQIDRLNIAEEIEDVAKSEHRELANRLTVLLCHLLKWQFQPTHRSHSWQRTVRDQRAAIERRLAKMPTLRPVLAMTNGFPTHSKMRCALHLNRLASMNGPTLVRGRFGRYSGPTSYPAEI